MTLSNDRYLTVIIIVHIVLSWILLGVVLVLENGAHYSNSLVGYVSVVGASLSFGGTGIPMKYDKLKEINIDPSVFSLYNGIGLFIVTLPFIIYSLINRSFEFLPFSILGALFIAIIGYFAFIAVQLLGYAKAPAIWAGIGMMTAYLWGKLYFQEVSSNLTLSVLSIVSLIAGVYCVSTSQDKPYSTSNVQSSEDDLTFDTIKNSANGSVTARLMVPTTEDEKRDENFQIYDEENNDPKILSNAISNPIHKPSRSQLIYAQLLAKKAANTENKNVIKFSALHHDEQDLCDELVTNKTLPRPLNTISIFNQSHLLETAENEAIKRPNFSSTGTFGNGVNNTTTSGDGGDKIAMMTIDPSNALFSPKKLTVSTIHTVTSSSERSPPRSPSRSPQRSPPRSPMKPFVAPLDLYDVKGYSPQKVRAKIKAKKSDTGDLKYFYMGDERLPAPTQFQQLFYTPLSYMKRKVVYGYIYCSQACLHVMFRSSYSGYLFCLLTGWLDGSLMLPFKLSLSSHTGGTDSTGGTSGSSGSGSNLSILYICSLGISSLVVSPLMYVLYSTFIRPSQQQQQQQQLQQLSNNLRNNQQQSRRTAFNNNNNSNEEDEDEDEEERDKIRVFKHKELQVALFPGLCSGALWATANVMSVKATQYLGMKVGFPLTQTCILITALWGVFYFKEFDVMRSGYGLRFGLGIVLVLVGAYVLGASSSL